MIVAPIARASIDGAYVDDVILSWDYSTACESPQRMRVVRISHSALLLGGLSRVHQQIS